MSSADAAPNASAGDPAGPGPGRSGAGSQKPRVLLVDDEPDFVEPIAFWLKAKGYLVTEAENGVKALELIKQVPPDVVFLDINMPQMNGIETLRHIRGFNPTLPVIMVTAAYDDQDKFQDAKALGIAGFFPKSESLDQIGAILQTALRTLRTPRSPGR